MLVDKSLLTSTSVFEDLMLSLASHAAQMDEMCELEVRKV